MEYVLLLTILASIATFSYGDEIVITIKPEESQLLVKDGSSLTLSCISTSMDPLTWDLPKTEEGHWRHSITSNQHNGKTTSVLTIANFTYSGDYTCKLSKGSETFTESIQLVSVSESKVEPIYQYGNNSTKLSCTITSSDSSTTLENESVMWKKAGKAVSDLPDSQRFQLDGDNSLVIEKPKHDDIGPYTAFIKVRNFEKPYECEVNFKDEIVAPIKVEPSYDEDDKSVALSCNIEVGRKIQKVEWFKNNVSISKLEDPKRFEVVTANNTLIIDEPVWKDAGVYVARFTLEGLPEPYDCKVEYRVPPYVLAFTKSKNLIEKDKMELQCKVEGYPKAVVTWLKNDVALNMSDDERIQLHSMNGFKNARLVIKSIEFSDEGEYACHAYSSYFNKSDTKTITVRVKDKLAALWPFLGIVCEVIVLCTIIFIYEKRRNKRAEQEENKAQEADGPPMEKKDGLRHRGTSGNPGA